MRVLLDEQLPIDLSSQLRGHAVETVVGRGWAGIKNGELLSRMRGHYDVLITMDRGIEFQQQISAFPFGIVVVRARSNRMQHLSPLVPAILDGHGNGGGLGEGAPLLETGRRLPPLPNDDLQPPPP